MPRSKKSSPTDPTQTLLQLICIIQALSTLQPMASYPGSPTPSLPSPVRGAITGLGVVRQAPLPLAGPIIPIDQEYTWAAFQLDVAALRHDELVGELRERRRHWYTVCESNMTSVQELRETVETLQHDLAELDAASDAWAAKADSAEWKLGQMKTKRIKQDQEIAKLRKTIADLKKESKGDKTSVTSVQESRDEGSASTPTRSADAALTNDRAEFDELTARANSMEKELADRESQLQERAVTIKTLSAMLQDEQKAAVDKDSKITEMMAKLKELEAQQQKFKEMETIFHR